MGPLQLIPAKRKGQEGSATQLAPHTVHGAPQLVQVVVNVLRHHLGPALSVAGIFEHRDYHLEYKRKIIAGFIYKNFRRVET